MQRFKYFARLGLLFGFVQLADAQTITNPSFESDHFNSGVGYISQNSLITGWTASNTGRIGLNVGGINNPSGLVDNGAIPNGTNVAFIQATASSTNTLSTTISGLTVGTPYRVSFRANHRSPYQPGTQDWALNGGAFVPFTAFPAVGGNNPYYSNSAVFTATATSAALVLRNGMATNGDATVMVDNFTIASLPLQVTNAIDGAVGSLRQVASYLTNGATLTFAANLSGAILTLTNEIVLTKNITLDASALPGGIFLNGNYTHRIFTVTNGVTAKLNSLTLANGNYTNFNAGGAGILNFGTLTVSNCTLSGNTAIAGGAIDNESGNLTLNNCTLANNAANTGFGGAIYNRAALTLNQCTLAGNTASTGGAIDNDAGTLTLKACILAGNTASAGPELNLAGGSVSATSCLIGKADNSTITSANGNLVGSIATPLDARLAPLGYYGGPTATMPPLGGSPAIDAGGTTTLTTDQRGYPRVIDGDGNGNATADIGAVEYQLVVVQNVNDSGAGSLRAAVSAPNDRILFASALAGTNITLASQIVLTKNVTIDASALVGGISLNGNHASRIFYVTNGISATLNSLTITNGYANNNYGGGIYNLGTLTLNQCTLTGNAAGSGGAIENLYGCTLTLNNCTLTGNAAGAGGAIENASGTLNLNQCTVTGNTASNYGGAINNGSGASYFDPQQNSYVTAQGTATIYQSTLAGNTAASQGGAIYSSTGNSSYPAALTLNNSIVSGNTAPTDANITLGDSSFSGANNLTNGVPQLATLGNYGGPTATMPPLPGSPAIDAVASSTFSTDQRGFARIVGSAVDLGAVEVTQLFVVNTNDSGAGSLRQILLNAPTGATVAFTNTLAGQTIILNSQIILTNSVIIAAGNLPGGISLNGNGNSRIFNVANGSTVMLNSLTITNGYASGDLGGGILNAGTLTVNNSTLANNSANYGGAIYNGLGTLIVNNCTLANNFASNPGGAIYNDSGRLTMNNSTLANNSANGNGGAIFNASGTLTLNNSTLANNSANGNGGAIYNYLSMAAATLNNSTLANNSANYFGGAIYNNAGTLIVNNSIVAGNTAPTASNISGSFTGANNLTNGDPKLAQLGNYGGPTPTMPPLPGSPAIDYATGSTATTDQRGFPRPVDGNNDGIGISDIGAVEVTQLWVVNTNDSGAGSLRQTLLDAPTGATVAFANTLSGQTITLNSQIILTNSVIIAADNLPDGITISGSTTNRLFYVNPNQTVSLSSLTLTHGQGGGNTPNGPDRGGAIFNDHGNLSLDRCALVVNSAPKNGGAIYNYSGTMTVNNSTLTNNSASSDGGAIHNYYGTLSLNNSTLANNSAGSGGGAIINYSGTATLNNSTFFGNSAQKGGGGVFSYVGALNVNQCTVVGNSASGTTFGGGGGLNNYDGTATVSNSIVAGNTAPANANISGTFTGANNLTNGNPQLAALGNYGGPTLTMPPLPGSPAIDAATGSTATTDQRGFPRPVDGDNNGSAIADIGAVEVTQRWVVNTNDSGAGSLRAVVAAAPAYATVAFTNTLTGQTITLASQIILTNSVIIDASTLSGGITLTGTNRTFQVNSGNTVTLNSLTFANGYCDGDGGVIYNTYGARLTLNNCTLANNSAGGDSGAINNYSGTLTLNNCTLTGNSAQGNGGGVLSYVGTLNVNNCTLTGNSAQGSGGGVLSYAGTLNVNQCTVVGNSNSSTTFGGGGGLNNYAGTATVSNSIVAGNTAPANANIFGPFTGANNLTNGDPKLAPLGNYGGPTQTLPPLLGSPAIDAGGTTTLTTDQRGFPRVVGNAVDIGAVEVQLTGTTNPPVLAQVLITPDHTFQFTFTNTTGSSYRVLTSTNLALPLANWSSVGTVIESPAGQYHFTQTGVTNAAQFYRVVSP